MFQWPDFTLFWSTTALQTGAISDCVNINVYNFVGKNMILKYNILFLNGIWRASNCDLFIEKFYQKKQNYKSILSENAVIWNFDAGNSQ